MRRFVLSPVAILYHIFPHYVLNGSIFSGRADELNVKRVFWKNMSFARIIQPDVIVDVRRSSRIVPALAIFVRFLKKITLP
jgi:hypothetical protein